jgi:hypothetical protein
MPNEYQKDGDMLFVGLNSRDNPASLSSGIVSKSQNFRMDRGVATARKGLQRKTIGTLVGQTIYGTGTYILSSGQEMIVAVVADGLYSYNPQTEALSSKVYFPSRVTGKTLTSSGSQVVTVTSAAHGILSGASVYVECSSVGYTGLFVITSVTTNTFTYTMPSIASAGDVTGVACSYNAAQLITTPDGCDVCNALDKIFISRGFDKRPLMWDIATTITALPVSPSPAHQFPNCSGLMFYANRLIALGKHHNEPTALRNYDTVSVSNFLDYETWDALDAFTINNGGNDQIVSISPWTLNEFLVFMRNSIFYIGVGTSRYVTGDALSADSYVRTLATDIGCSARKSVVQAGGGVFFLSDSGVYFLQPQPASAESMKLLTMADPISAPIDDVIQRINRTYAHRAVATYWNNRYYLAVPLDDSTVNNSVLVYNFILRQWESVDTYPSLVTTKNALVANGGSPEAGWLFYDGQSVASPDYYYLSIRKYDLPRHGMAIGDYVNVTFGLSFSGATVVTERPPNGTYKVVNTSESGGLPFNDTDFAIRIPKSNFVIQPFNSPDIWTYTVGACSFAKAESVSLKEFIVAKKNNQRRMFLIDNIQGIFLTEELDFDEFGDSIGDPILPNPRTGVDTPANIAIGRYGNLILVSSLTSGGAPNPNVIILEALAFSKNDINAVLETRQYSFNGINDKRFSSYEANILTSGGEYIETYVNSLNPDVSVKVDELGSSSVEDYNRSNPIRKTGSHASIKFISYSKRPSIRSAFIYAKQQNKNNLNKQ